MSEAISEHVDRADWQRGEGMLLFSLVTDELLPQVEASISDTELRRTIRNNRRMSDYGKANGAVELIRNKVTNTTRTKLDSFLKENDASEDSMLEHTHAGYPSLLYREIIDTVALLPLNILELAQRQAKQEKKVPPVYKNLGGLAVVMGSEWFSGVIHSATLTANGVWARLSSRPVHPIDVRDHDFTFEYEVAGDVSTFNFDTRTADMLRQELRERNKEFRLHGRDHAMMLDSSTKAGSTAGCPVRYDHVSPAIDPGIVKSIAEAYKVSTESLMAPRQTGIDASLQFVGRVLQRAAVIDAEIN